SRLSPEGPAVRPRERPIDRSFDRDSAGGAENVWTVRIAGLRSAVVATASTSDPRSAYDGWFSAVRRRRRSSTRGTDLHPHGSPVPPPYTHNPRRWRDARGSRSNRRRPYAGYPVPP